ncbi:MAG: indole-3-glycerol phosphate synthase TrpC [Actinomycetota bacterium]
MGFLTDLIAGRRRELERRPLDDSMLLARALAMPPARDFVGALRARAGRPAVIAEVKRASPSAGAIADRDPSDQAVAYASAGASAISVLTEQAHFHGSLADLRAARMACDLPVLRKDFLIHPSELIESRAAGADAILLIAACLSANELVAMLATARDLGLGALVETHSDQDLEKVLLTDAEIVGVNARDLETLDVDFERALAHLTRIPDGRLAVMESGIATRDQVRAAVDAGASAILVGEALMRADDPGAKLREMLGEET